MNHSRKCNLISQAYFNKEVSQGHSQKENKKNTRSRRKPNIFANLPQLSSKSCSVSGPLWKGLGCTEKARVGVARFMKLWGWHGLRNIFLFLSCFVQHPVFHSCASKNPQAARGSAVERESKTLYRAASRTWLKPCSFLRALYIKATALLWGLSPESDSQT